MNITGCTVTENTANKYGGGFAAEDNKSGGKTTFTDTVLCNNIADKAGSDVYLKSSPATLQSAPSMDSLYLGKPEDVHNRKIDGWYEDVASARYTGQTKEERKEYTGYTNIGDSGEVYLIAAAKPSLAKIKFTNEDGSHVYKETWYPIGTTAKDVVLPDAAKESDETYDYVFKGWSPDIKDVTEDAVYTAVFEKVLKEQGPSDNGGTPSGNDKTPSAKPGSTSPQTGDTGNIGFWLTLLLLGGGALIATTAARTTKKNNK